MHDEMKLRMGVEKANCETCTYLGSDGDGYEYNGTWPVCDKIDRMSYLKSFPFKKEMKCWQPNFWLSKFAGLIRRGHDHECMVAAKLFFANLIAPSKKYRHMWE
jgi:hypothetical protein